VGLVSLLEKLRCLGEPNWRNRTVKVGRQGREEGLSILTVLAFFFFFLIWHEYELQLPFMHCQ